MVLKNNSIVVIQNTRFDGFFNVLGRIGFRRNIDKIVVYTEHDKATLVSLCPKMHLDKEISIIPLACRFEKSTELPALTNKLVTVARIEEYSKNFSAMCKVMSLLSSDFTLDIYGTGTKEEIDSLKEKIKSNTQINFKGVVHNVDLVLRHYSLFIMTFYFKGFGQSLIEARSQGLPLVAFETFDALQTIISNDFNGYRIKPFDCVDFANAIKNILSSNDSYIDFSKSAIKKSVETEHAFFSEKWALLFSELEGDCLK